MYHLSFINILSQKLYIYTELMITLLFHICRFHQTYDYMYNLCVADDSIEPGKYLVEGYPTLHDSPLKHPNKEMAFLKDEL